MTLSRNPKSGSAAASEHSRPAAGIGARPPGFTWAVRVYYEDTDAGGVVYYANYLRFFERCRTEWMRELGFGQSALREKEGVLFVVASAQIHYRRPARLDDELLIDARIGERFASYVVFDQQALRDGQVICHARVKVACVDAATLRPTRLPAALAARLPAADAAGEAAIPTTTV